MKVYLLLIITISYVQASEEFLDSDTFFFIKIAIFSALLTIYIAKKQKRNPYTHAVMSLFIPILWAVFLLFIGEKRRGDNSCPWCGSKKLIYLNGFEGEWSWKYKNKDGSQDKRRKNNYQIANYTSIWQCKKCNAKLSKQHYQDRNPSKKVAVYKNELFEDGNGKRVAKNFINE